MPTRNLVLTAQQDQFIRGLVDGGHYQNASEVLRDSLRLLERRMREDEARIEGLRRAVAAGEQDEALGNVADYDPEFLDEIEADLDRS